MSCCEKMGYPVAVYTGPKGTPFFWDTWSGTRSAPDLQRAWTMFDVVAASVFWGNDIQSISQTKQNKVIMVIDLERTIQFITHPSFVFDYEWRHFSWKKCLCKKKMHFFVFFYLCSTLYCPYFILHRAKAWLFLFFQAWHILHDFEWLRNRKKIENLYWDSCCNTIILYWIQHVIRSEGTFTHIIYKDGWRNFETGNPIVGIANLMFHILEHLLRIGV